MIFSYDEIWVSSISLLLPKIYCLPTRLLQIKSFSSYFIWLYKMQQQALCFVQNVQKVKHKI